MFDRIAGLQRYARPACLVGAAGLVLALFARIMAYPLRHDEQFYLPVAKHLGEWPLYGVINFTHLPNLPLLLDGLFTLTGSGHALLKARLLIFLVWLLAAGALYAIARFAHCGRAVSLLIAALLALNPLLLGPAGMLATNNFIPAPFALLGLLFFLKGCAAERPSAWWCFLAGVFLSLAIGFKANYALVIPPFALAALLVPPASPLIVRLTRVALPLALGAALAGLPTLIYFAQDPASFLAHVVSFHQTAHVDFWTANAGSEGPIALSWVEKAVMAQSVWLSGGTLLIFLLALTLGITALLDREPNDAPWWPIILTLGLIAFAALVSFLPTPSFPQYYSPPIALGLALCALLIGRLGEQARRQSGPVLAGVFLLSAFGALPSLAPDLPSLARPSKWTGNSVNRASQEIARLMAQQPGEGPLLTLSPIYAAETDQPVYSGLVLGPFIYRAVDYLPAEQRGHFARVTSPRTLDAMLAQTPPKAVLVGMEEELDGPLEAWALAHGYRPVEVKLGDKRVKTGRLYLAPVSR